MPTRRAADRSGQVGAHVDATGVAQYLLERRAALDEALRHQDDSAMATVMRRTPPIPAALLMIGSDASRERFARLLVNANIELDEAGNPDEALARLERRIHALLLTDSVDLIRRARQLQSGPATHIVFIDIAAGAGYAEALRAGANDCLSSEGRGEQFWAQLTTARRIVDLAASLQLALTDNRILSTIDELTRTGSRRFFEHQFPREVQRAAHLGHPLALVMCDIDHFKRINDQHGHQIGDEVLTEFALRLTHDLRLREDWVARVGGEEFAVVLPEASELEARRIADRLCARIADQPFALSDRSIPVTASFGVCSIERHVGDANALPETMVRAADTALYESKRAGRNRVTLAAQGTPGPGPLRAQA